MTANIAAKPTKRSGRQRRMSKLSLRGKPKAGAAGFWQLVNSPSTRKDTITTFLMKSIPHIFLALSAVTVASQLTAAGPSKPGFIVKPSQITAARTLLQDGRALLLGEIKPIALPIPLQPTAPAPTTQALLTDPAANPLENNLLVLGATVFRLPDGTVRSLATLRIPGTTQSTTFLSTADFGLIAGLDSLLTADGKTHPIILAWSEEPCDSLATLTAQIQLSHGLKSLPKLAPGPATFTLITGRPPAATLTAFQSLHRLYQSEHPRLLAAHQARERTRLAALKSPPLPPKNLVLHHWNIGQSTPAPVTQGGTQ